MYHPLTREQEKILGDAQKRGQQRDQELRNAPAGWRQIPAEELEAKRRKAYQYAF